MRDLRWLMFAIAFAFSAVAFAQTDVGSLCVAPASAKPPERCAPGLCDGGALTFRIDKGPKMDWSATKSVVVPIADKSVRHRVTIFRAGKQQQSFTFRFSEFHGKRLCLFLNDLYWTAQLWHEDQAPWCRCQKQL